MSHNNRTKNILLVALVVMGLVFLLSTGTYWMLRSGENPEPTSSPVQEASPTTALPPSPTASSPVAILSYDVDQRHIATGECVILSWAVENADRVVLKRDDLVLLDNAPTSDTFRDCPSQAGTLVYRLEASRGSGIPNWLELQVVVSQPSGAVEPVSTIPASAPTPPMVTTLTVFPPTRAPVTLPPASGPVTILYYSVEPEWVRVGKCVTLSWGVLNADSVKVLRNGDPVASDLPLEGTVEDCPDQPGTSVYRLDASNSSGYSNYLELMAYVNP